MSMIENPFAVTVACPEKTLTKQAFKDECDINMIMARYEKQGMLPHVESFEGFYDDVSDLPDYRGAFEVVARAGEQFATLPAELRAKFDNDPAVYLDFVMDPANRDEMIKLGMVADPEEQKRLREQERSAKIAEQVDIQTEVDLRRQRAAAVKLKE